MFGSSILDVAIGMVVLFFFLSVICSAASELIELGIKQRASNLEAGIKELVGDTVKNSAFVKAIYDHGLVSGLYRGDYGATEGDRKAQLPSYIPAANFAIAIMSVVKNLVETNQSAQIPPNVVSAFKAFETRAADDLTKYQALVETWYNTSMDRVSGWYKRRAQIIILAIGLVAAVTINADCVEIATRLAKDSALRQSLVSVADGIAHRPPATGSKPFDTIKETGAALDNLGLPIGWAPPGPNEQLTDRFVYAVTHHWPGWILTALGVSLGAPFWFDLLNKLISIRSTIKPKASDGDAQAASS